jgi:hypothetical protein
VKAEHAIFYGPFAIAGILTILALVVWHRNLGPTPSVWVLLASAALLVGLGLVLPIGIWVGDM